MRSAFVIALAMAAGSAASAQQASVVNSPHNLSASGPGPVRAATENEVCIFCHAPHNSSPIQPLWNRLMPTEGYTIYTSRALNAKPGQPTGSSKMCLSCHDGTIALGTVISRDQPIMMSKGVTTIPAGAANIGTDLRDDHPISFRYDSSLAAHNPNLKSPSSLPPEIRLDANSELQCTSCHDAHNNSLTNFLVMRNDNSEMCKSCHQVGQTAVGGHANCTACHQSHTSPSGPYLLKKATISDTCLTCHNGSVPTAANIASDMRKLSAHDTNSPVDPPPPLADHVSCADCHEPHTMGRGAGIAPGLPANFGRVSGISNSASALKTANNEYEVCFKCHSDGGTHKPWVSRRLGEINTRAQFSPSAVSFHPVEAPGRNSHVPSLRPGWTVGSRVACTSCHGSDSSRAAGGSGPNGLHGSSFAPNLIARYEVRDLTTESSQAYALCYTCHDRANILSNQSFKGHSLHIVDQRTPCAACHASHGVSSRGSMQNNSNLINFATSIVFPDKITGKLQYVNQGTSRDQCFLSCHGVNHSPAAYPSSAVKVGVPASTRRAPGR